MISQQRRTSDQVDPEFVIRGQRSGTGSLLMATLLGVGIGLLAAPQPGSKTRKLLKKRLAALSEGVGEGLEEVQEAGSKARKRARERLARLREDAGEEWEEVGERLKRARGRFRDFEESDSDDSSPFGTLFAIAAGVAATFLLTSDRAAPVRSRMQDAASDVRRRATDQWDRFQRGGTRQAREDLGSQAGQPESRAGTTPGSDAPQAS
ncbi:MAG TPA: YtxH domain-containing protein [Gemmatimonadales bacterium]|nr:YtxH domain-containing protein [Gemmatimonadales bacterium]